MLRFPLRGHAACALPALLALFLSVNPRYRDWPRDRRAPFSAIAGSI